MLLADGLQIRSIHGKNLVGRILQQSESGIVVAQRLLDARIGFVEEQHQVRERGLRLVALQRSEALRMRIFLERSRARPSRTINAQ